MNNSSRFERLLQPIRLGNLNVNNRFVVAPIGVNLATKDGFVTEQLKAYYQEPARGGAGLVVVDQACVDSPTGKATPNQLYIDDDRYVQGQSELAKVIQKHGAKSAIQLTHAGRLARYTDCQAVAPSPIAASGFGVPRELSIAEIEVIVNKFAQGAERAQKSGFDGVEIQACHGFLLTSFLSADSNKRRDAYGGHLGNRARMLLDIITAVRQKVGQSYPVWVRLTAQEFNTDNGIILEEAKRLARWLEEADVVALNVTADYIKANVGMAWPVPGEKFRRPPAAHPHAFLVPWAEEIKKVVSIPVMAVGWMTPETGEQAIQRGKIDMVAMARPFLADPDIPKKVASGRLDEIRPCIGCLRCREQIAMGKKVVCAVNASAGRELECPIVPAKQKKRVVVVGGGPAGMEAARIAALRGHEVILFDKETSLGGQLLIASLPPYKDILAELVSYFRTQLDRLGVNVELGEEATPVTILGAKPDAVVIATGVTRSVPDIPGIETAKVVDAADVLSSKVKVGDTIVIIGGGETGCETAEFLADKDRRVSIVEMRDNLASDMERSHRQYLLQRLDMRGINILTRTKAEAVHEKGLVVRTEDGKELLMATDNIVLATGARPSQGLYQEISDNVADTYRVGDCVEARSILEAITEGFLTGQTI